MVHRYVPPYLGEDYDQHWGYLTFTGKVVLDLGADIGSTASWLFSKGARRVIAVEGDPGVSVRLKENFGDDADVVALSIFIDDPWVIERLIVEFAPDIIKMDCESCEKHLPLCDKNIVRTVPEFLVEAHSPTLSNTLTAFFLQMGYDCSVATRLSDTKCVLKAVRHCAALHRDERGGQLGTNK